MRPSRLWALFAGAVIAAADAAFHTVKPGLVVAGALDEPAHAATTVLILAALGWPRDRRFIAGALIASVAIDLDHVPQYLGTDFLTDGTPRPYTHSWVTLAAVGVLALGLRGRWRNVALGAELGLLGHLFRDMAEPSSQGGIALFWPFSYANFHVPYFAYALVMGGTLVATMVRGRSAQGDRWLRWTAGSAEPPREGAA